MTPCSPTFVYRRRQLCDAPCFVRSACTSCCNDSRFGAFWLPLLLIAVFPCVVRTFLILGKLLISAFVLHAFVSFLLKSSCMVMCCLNDDDEENACRASRKVIHENKKEAKEPHGFDFTIAAPGVRQNDLSVTVEGDVVHVSGSSRVGERVFHVDKRVRLPTSVDLDAAVVTYADGALHFKMPVRRAVLRPTPAYSLAHAASPEGEPCASDEKPLKPDDKKKEASTSTLLQEVEPDDANVQVPEETVDEVEDEWLAEWDEMLADLSEMGFEDRQRNRQALAKHSGSIKHAVKELVESRKPR